MGIGEGLDEAESLARQAMARAEASEEAASKVVGTLPFGTSSKPSIVVETEKQSDAHLQAELAQCQRQISALHDQLLKTQSDLEHTRTERDSLSVELRMRTTTTIDQDRKQESSAARPTRANS